MKYRKKPIVIDAILWNERNFWEVVDFINNETLYTLSEQDTLSIDTLEGRMMVNTGDYIIKGVNGEFYPCKPDIFEKTYEKVELEVDSD